MTVRWLFADQLGTHFTADLADDDHVLLVFSKAVLARHTVHRAKAHLLLSALRHRAAELGPRATLLTVDRYADALALVQPDEVIDPTSRAARSFVRRLGLRVLPARGFATSEDMFASWAKGRGTRRLLMDDWYRHVRRELGVLVDAGEPAGGRWNFDAENRLPPPAGQRTLGLPAAWRPAEDAIDAGVRADLDAWQAAGRMRFLGQDGPRQFAATGMEARQALDDFIAHRLAAFGPYEDATMAADPVMAHALISPAMNLGLLDPREVVQAALSAHRDGRAPLQSVEGFIRQVLGWREYIWHLYWHEAGPASAGSAAAPNALNAHADLPAWFAELKDDQVRASCLSWALSQVRARGWAHHIVRLMILGNWAAQRGYRPQDLADWFTRAFVDGYPWVMTANVIGMSQYADGGRTATKPYVSGGAYLHRMTDLCHGCRYRPGTRVGPKACPFTAGYWWFIDRNREILRGNHRMAQPLRGIDRLADRDALIEQEAARGSQAP